MMQRWQKQTGFTLVEMIITIAIIAIISSFAYPSMQQKIATMRVQNAANQLETSLKQARADAIIYRSNVSAVGTGSTSPSSVTLNQLGNQTGNNNYPQTITFNQNIRPINDFSITFTSTKAVINAPINVDFCYRGISTNKYRVIIDAMSNINTITSADDKNKVAADKIGDCL